MLHLRAASLPQSSSVNGGGGSARERAWAALSANALVVPGLGSIVYLRRRSGWLQAGLGVAGFALTVSWLALTVQDWLREGLPASVPRPGVLLAGAALFAAGWLWGLADGLAALRAAPPEPPEHA
jgi:hypothetical protein